MDYQSYQLNQVGQSRLLQAINMVFFEENEIRDVEKMATIEFDSVEIGTMLRILF